MYRLFSIEQANSLIPQVDQTLEELRTASAELRRIATEMRSLEPYSLEARNLFFESAFLAQQVHDLKRQLDELGVQVADPETGRLGFPGQIGAELVYLTWETGSDRVSHFRRLAGRAETVPLSQQHLQDQGSAAA